MRKRLFLLVLCFLLTGCSTADTFETLGQIQHQQENPVRSSSICISLPDSAAAETFGGQELVYDCDGYTLALQTLSAGDLEATVQSLSGFDLEKLTVMESRAGEYKRYDWVWTAAGSEGQLLCRAAVLDDGNYHYCVYTMAPAAKAGELTQQWNAIFGSLELD